MRHNYRKEATEVLVKLIGNTQKAIDQNDDEDDVELMKTLGQIKTNLAACYRDMGEHRKSLNVYLEIEALVEDEELITLTKDEVLQLKKEIAKLHYRVNNFERALVMYLQLYSDYIELHEGEESIETLSIRTSIAEVLLKQDKLEDALKVNWKYSYILRDMLKITYLGRHHQRNHCVFESMVSDRHKSPTFAHCILVIYLQPFTELYGNWENLAI